MTTRAPDDLVVRLLLREAYESRTPELRTTPMAAYYRYMTDFKLKPYLIEMLEWKGRRRCRTVRLDTPWID